ncbi:hypothetical protein UlMin_018119 [Ulmus minor]
MKEAVSARNAFAAAHSSYAMYLKNTGAALSDYGQGEVQNPQLAQTQSNPAPPAAAQTPFVENFPPPPPPPSNFAPPPPLQRASSMPEIKIPKPEPKQKPNPIMEGDEDEDEDEIENEEDNGGLIRRRSDRSSSSRGGHIEFVDDDDEPPPQPQAPPSPTRAMPSTSQGSRPTSTAYHAQDTWNEFFFNVDTMPRPTLSEVEEEVNASKEEIDRNVFDDRPKRVNHEEDRGRSAKVEPVPMPEIPVEPERPLPPAPAQAAAAGKSLKKVKQVASGSGEGKRMVKHSVNLLQILVELDDHFLKASESAHEVSKMLEATRLHYHSNFADNRGHIDHSARVMRVITWNRSFKGMANIDDGNDDLDLEEHETHATVLDKLLAWEKKLYDEVKAGEHMKFEYQRKVASLNKLKKRGNNSDALEKAKATVSHLHTRYIVDMQSMDSTVSEINRLRDEQLYPKLAQLVEGMATMWETMGIHHESQSKLVQALRSLDISQSPKETSEHHHDRTYQLFIVVQEWNSQFKKLISKQKEYIRFLNNWLKLNLVPIESSLKEKVSSPPRPQTPPIQRLLLVWQDHLEKLPDEHARTAIENFAAVIETILHQQDEEIKLREKCDDTRRELSRKARQFDDWYNKYMNRKIPDGVEPDSATGDEAIAERQFMVESVKKRLEDEEEAYQRQCLQVREKSLASLKSRLPELFRALSDFAVACSAMYGDLRSRSHSH